MLGKEPNYEEAEVPHYDLPDPLITAEGIYNGASQHVRKLSGSTKPSYVIRGSVRAGDGRSGRGHAAIPSSPDHHVVQQDREVEAARSRERARNLFDKRGAAYRAPRVKPHLG